MKAGKHVLCEKPLSVTVAQSDEVLNAAAQSRGMFVVVHQKRFEPAFLYAKQLLDSGELGPLYRCSMIESAWRSETYYRASPWRGTWRGEGGGVLLNHLQPRSTATFRAVAWASVAATRSNNELDLIARACSWPITPSPITPKRIRFAVAATGTGFASKTGAGATISTLRFEVVLV